MTLIETHTEGATLEHRDSNGNTALHHACEAGHLECVRALLSREAASATPGTADAAAVAAILEGTFCSTNNYAMIVQCVRLGIIGAGVQFFFSFFFSYLSFPYSLFEAVR